MALSFGHTEGVPQSIEVLLAIILQSTELPKSTRKDNLAGTLSANKKSGLSCKSTVGSTVRSTAGSNCREQL